MLYTIHYTINYAIYYVLYTILYIRYYRTYTIMYYILSIYDVVSLYMHTPGCRALGGPGSSIGVTGGSGGYIVILLAGVFLGDLRGRTPGRPGHTKKATGEFPEGAGYD